jgi:hypothetical protein
MKKRLIDFVIAACSIYLTLSLMIAAPLFNWRYARQHGFGKWLAFGEFIATAQAAIWPYYALTGSGSDRRNSLEARSNLHFDNSASDCVAAMKLLGQFGVMSLPTNESSNVVMMLRAAVTEASLVDDSYLRRAHPEMVKRYREDYAASLSTLADALQTGERAKQLLALATYDTFAEWMQTHNKELKFPE